MTYQEFIEECKGKNPEEFQQHHIVPKCIGGTDDEDNLINLSYEDHWMAHKLLAEENPDNKKLVSAFNYFGKDVNRWVERAKKIALQKGQGNPFYGKTHTEEQRKKWSEMYSGSGNPMYGTNRSGELNPNYGNHYSEESKKKISESLKGHKDSDETRYKKHLATSGENNPMYGKEHPNKGKKMYNNGVVQVLSFECPEGFVLGRLRKAV